MTTTDRTAAELLYRAWGVIANVSSGDWQQQSGEWRDAAERWRDAWHATLDPEAATDPAPQAGDAPAAPGPHPGGTPEGAEADPGGLDLDAVEARANAARPSRLRTAMGCIPDGTIQQGCIVSDGSTIREAVRAAAQLAFKDVPALVAEVRRLRAERAEAERQVEVAYRSMCEAQAERDRQRDAARAELEQTREALGAYATGEGEMPVRDSRIRRNAAADALVWAADRLRSVYGDGISDEDGTLIVEWTDEPGIGPIPRWGRPEGVAERIADALAAGGWRKTTPDVDPAEVEAGLTVTDLDAGVAALARLLPGWRAGGRLDPLVVAVLRAVLPGHGARVRADERARVAEEISQAIEAAEDVDEDGFVYGFQAAAIARQHATPPTEETD